MSSQSSISISSHYEDDQDDMCSCDSYSSGWERSSTSEYLESTCTEDVVDDDFCAMGEFYIPPISTGATKIFDMEYKCDLVVLPNPYRKVVVEENKNNHSVVIGHEVNLIQETAPSLTTTTITNPWKEIKNIDQQHQEDPWKFLEVKKEVLTAPRSVPKAVMEKKKIVIDNSNTNKLCKYKNDCRMNKTNSCTMVHSLAEWKPRICRFNNGCRRKNSCGYYHTEMPLKEYLRLMLNTKDSMYAKNAVLYQKYM